MPKYRSLQALLEGHSGAVELTLDEVDALVPGGLPASAYLYEAWWDNQNPTHHQSDAWANAGYQAQVDLARKEVRFSPR